MNSKTTWTLVALAAGLYAFIWFFERHISQNPAAAKHARVLPQLNPPKVTSIQIRPAAQDEIRADRTNNAWMLTKPFSYPAQPSAIDALLDALQKLPGQSYISAEELKNRPGSNKEFGFDSPLISVIFQQDDYRGQLLIGKRTALGDEVFVQVVGVEGLYVVDATLLNYFPRSANDWRNPVFVNLQNVSFDRISVTNAGKVFELQRDATNKAWRMTQPIKARADNTRIGELLRRLNNARVEQFVSDNVRADLESLGLQPPELALGFAQGTNQLLSLQFGKTPTNAPGSMFAKVAGQNSVVLVSSQMVAPWRVPTYNDFRERRLVSAELADIRQIEIRGAENFIVQRQPNGAWQIAGAESLNPDAGAVLELVSDLNNLEVAQFTTDAATDVDFRDHGLAPPARQYILRSAPAPTGTNLSAPAMTNTVLAEIHFGSTNEGRVFTRRADENYIYAVNLTDLLSLPSATWQFRDRRIWNFSGKDVQRVTIRQNGKTWELLHSGTNHWTFAPGSQGILNVFGVEEAVHRLSGLAAAAWIARGDEARKQFGFAGRSLQVSLDVKNGDKAQTFTVDFSGTFSPRQQATAAVSLDGQTWIFECPRQIFEPVELFLTIPANP